MEKEFDSLDIRLLRELQRDGRITNSALAERIGLSEAPCWRRSKRLEAEGFVDGYRAILNRRALGFGVCAIVNVRFSTHDPSLAQAFEERVRSLDSILSCHNVTGDVDYILEVLVKDLDAYGAFTMLLRSLPGVTSIHSSLSLKVIKSTTSLPI